MIKATFKLDTIEAYYQQQKQRSDKAILNAFKFAGESFVRDARLKTASEGGFNDITGNLRSSIGYLIIQDGKQLELNFKPSDNGTERQKGVDQGITFSQEIASEFPKGIALICVAGMEYAVYVESKGKDVITGSSLELETKLKSLLSQL